MKKLTTLKLLMAVAMLSFLTGFSQEKPVTKLLKSYIANSNELCETKQVNNVLSLFDDRYKNNIAYVGLSGIVKRSTIGFEQFSEQLAENVKNKNYNFHMTIGEIVHESQKERAGTVSALVNFESKIDGKVAEKGTILMNIVASLVRGEWKIIHNNTVRVSEGSDIGNCVCYLYAKGSTMFNAETYYPAGVEYDREYQSFRVSTRDGKRIIKGNDVTYSWTENGDVLDGARKIGNAKSSDEAVKAVLVYIYAQTCTKMDFN
jgi:hypothetical protein